MSHLALGATLLTVIPFLVHVVRITNSPVAQDGDSVAILSRSSGITHGRLPAVGMPTTASAGGPQLFHPGPAEMYYLALPVRIFGPTGGAVFITLLHTACFVVATGLLIRRLGRTGAVVGVLVSATAAFTILPLFHSAWNPYVLWGPSWLMAAAAIAVIGSAVPPTNNDDPKMAPSSGSPCDVAALIALWVAGSFVMQAHLSAFVPAALTVAGTTIWLVWATRGRCIARRPLIAGLTATALMWLPLLLHGVQGFRNLWNVGTSPIGGKTKVGADAVAYFAGSLWPPPALLHDVDLTAPTKRSAASVIIIVVAAAAVGFLRGGIRRRIAFGGAALVGTCLLGLSLVPADLLNLFQRNVIASTMFGYVGIVALVAAAVAPTPSQLARIDARLLRSGVALGGFAVGVVVVASTLSAIREPVSDQVELHRNAQESKFVAVVESTFSRDQPLEFSIGGAPLTEAISAVVFRLQWDGWDARLNSSDAPDSMRLATHNPKAIRILYQSGPKARIPEGDELAAYRPPLTGRRRSIDGIEDLLRRHTGDDPNWSRIGFYGSATPRSDPELILDTRAIVPRWLSRDAELGDAELARDLNHYYAGLDGAGSIRVLTEPE